MSGRWQLGLEGGEAQGEPYQALPSAMMWIPKTEALKFYFSLGVP